MKLLDKRKVKIQKKLIEEFVSPYILQSNDMKNNSRCKRHREMSRNPNKGYNSGKSLDRRKNIKKSRGKYSKNRTQRQYKRILSFTFVYYLSLHLCIFLCELQRVLTVRFRFIFVFRPILIGWQYIGIVSVLYLVQQLSIVNFSSFKLDTCVITCITDEVRIEPNKSFSYIVCITLMLVFYSNQPYNHLDILYAPMNNYHILSIYPVDNFKLIISIEL